MYCEAFTLSSSEFTLKYTWASTRALRLSLVMISCGSASTMISVTFTRNIRWMMGNTQLNPGWAKRRYFPSVSTSPRLVGRTIRMPMRKMKTRIGTQICTGIPWVHLQLG